MSQLTTEQIEKLGQILGAKLTAAYNIRIPHERCGSCDKVHAYDTADAEGLGGAIAVIIRGWVAENA